MTDETEEDEYVPEPTEIMDGGCLIFDPVEFAEMTESIAAMMRDGVLFVLDRETRKWRNVEAQNKPATVRPLKAASPTS